MVAKLKEILSTLDCLTRNSGSIPDMSVEMEISQKHSYYANKLYKSMFHHNPFWQGRLITPHFYFMENII